MCNSNNSRLPCQQENLGRDAPALGDENDSGGVCERVYSATGGMLTICVKRSQGLKSSFMELVPPKGLLPLRKYSTSSHSRANLLDHPASCKRETLRLVAEREGRHLLLS